MKRLWVFFLLCACTTRTDLIASRYLKKVQVSADAGVSFTISAAESERFAGTTVTLSPGALASDTELTVEEGFAALATGTDTALSPVLWLGPDGTALSSPAQLTLPLSGLAASDVESDVQVLAERSGALARLEVPAVTVALSAATVSFTVSALGRSQAVLRTCTVNGECAPGECVDGRCRGASCGSVRCALGGLCCSASCEQCAAPGSACPVVAATCGTCSAAKPCASTQTCVNGSCRDSTPVACGTTTCAVGQTCCNPTCGQCVSAGQACPSACPVTSCSNACGTANPTSCCPSGEVCVSGTCQPEKVSCGSAVCQGGKTCCNASCDTCVESGQTCSQVSCLCAESQCGPKLTTPSCSCSDGSLGCNTGRCLRSTTDASSCHWEVRTCP